MISIGILWSQYGPYHLARARSLRKLANPTKVHALELSDLTNCYKWTRAEEAPEVTTLCRGMVSERLPFPTVFKRTRANLIKLGIQVCLMPSYAPMPSLAALLAAKSLGIKTVMMNESHAGTARAHGISAFVKRGLVRLFDAALVGGQPQKRYFVSLGMREDCIFTGYDAVDNDYFARRAEEVRSRMLEIRSQYDLPHNYFLSLGRFVPKKNLGMLIKAYRNFLDARPRSQTHLVFVGDGEERESLYSLCDKLRLQVWDKATVEGQVPVNGNFLPSDRKSNSPKTNDGPGVHFYGFRQIEENPVFYALADAFFLPSLYEEWGLVVNEAMASGLPVVVSETAGCAEDLFETGPIKLSAPESDELLNGPAHLIGRIRQNGFVINPRSLEELAHAMTVLATFPKLRCDMGRASHRIIERFSCNNFAENALHAVQAALGNGKPATLRTPVRV
jgi:glycosyltransferase involved in cell wall biosynthesis